MDRQSRESKAAFKQRKSVEAAPAARRGNRDNLSFLKATLRNCRDPWKRWGAPQGRITQPGETIPFARVSSFEHNATSRTPLDDLERSRSSPSGSARRPAASPPHVDSSPLPPPLATMSSIVAGRGRPRPASSIRRPQFAPCGGPNGFGRNAVCPAHPVSPALPSAQRPLIEGSAIHLK